MGVRHATQGSWVINYIFDECINVVFKNLLFNAKANPLCVNNDKAASKSMAN